MPLGASGHQPGRSCPGICRQRGACFLALGMGSWGLSLPSRPLHPSIIHCRGRQVAIDVAEALVYLHNELGVLHSDLKARYIGG